MIYTEGRIKKKRIHILINPSKFAKLSGQAKVDETEINVASLTHLLAMETSIVKNDLIKRVVKIAELTNKPIITNKLSAQKFKDRGLSIRQLRILGFEEEIIDGIIIDPIYVEELDVSFQEQTRKSSLLSLGGLSERAIQMGRKVPGIINPLKWKTVKKLRNTSVENEEEINPKNPLAVYLKFSKSFDVLVPLDKRALNSLDELIPDITPKLLILPNLDVSQTYEINRSADIVLFVNQSNQQEKVLVMPKTHNPSAKHDTIYAAFEEWIEIDKYI